MTNTDELRQMLTEAGVEWMPSVWSAKDETFYKVEDVGYLATELSSGKMKVCIEGYPTPAQAIAATVGRGTCEADETETIKCWVKCKDEPSTEHMELIHVMECSECGHTYEHVNGDYEFCPRCGRRRVVDE